jgi:hypothetical protein
MNYGLHIIRFPSGRFGFAGSLPHSLGNLVPATTADIMDGRACGTDEEGHALTLRFPSFGTREEAVDYAAVRGLTVQEA